MSSPCLDQAGSKGSALVDQIVLVPGLACTEQLFAEQLGRVANYASIQIADTRQDETIAGMASRLLDAADGPFCLAGLSMGGYVAMEVIRQAPQRVTKLALLDTTAAPENDNARTNRLKLIDLAREGRIEEIHDMLWPRLVAAGHQSDSDLEAKVYAMLASTGCEVFIKQQTAIMARADARQHLADIRVPTLVVVGSEDAITPVSVAQDIVSRINGADLVVIDGSGHLTTMEAGAKVADAMEAWLRH